MAWYNPFSWLEEKGYKLNGYYLRCPVCERKLRDKVLFNAQLEKVYDREECFTRDVCVYALNNNQIVGGEIVETGLEDIQALLATGRIKVPQEKMALLPGNSLESVLFISKK